MRRDEYRLLNGLIAVVTIAFLVILVIVAVSGCGNSKPRSSDHKHYSQVYVGDDGYYTRSYDGNTLIWWLITSNSTPTQSVPPKFDGAWTRSSTPPSNPTPTSTVVQTGDKGVPDEKTQPESEVDETEVTDQSTSEQDAQDAAASDSQDSGGDSGSSGDSGSGGDSGGDSGGGDSGGGGGDGGGGDAGGF